MAKAFKVSIRGSRELQRQLKAASKGLAQAALPVVTEAAQDALAQSQARVPVQSGALKASGSMQPAEIRHGAVAFATVEYDHPFAAHIHEGYPGTDERQVAPPKFLRDGAKTVRTKFRQGLRALLKSFLTTNLRSK